MDPRNAQTEKPPLHAKHWLAITGKPLSATAGAMMFQKGGNAVDAAAAMLAAGCTMWDTLGCGGETQALIYNPKTKKVIGLNALGVAPTGATAEFYKSKGYKYPARVRAARSRYTRHDGRAPDHAGRVGQAVGSRTCLRPAIQMADGYAIEAQLANSIERQKSWTKQWKYSPAVFLPHLGQSARSAGAGRSVRAEGSRRDVPEARRGGEAAKAAGKTRKQAIYAAYDRFYKGDIAQEIVHGVREDGGLFTMQDLASWKVKIEEPLHTSYKGIEVYKLPLWQQGAALLQALNILENTDVKAWGTTRRSTSTRSTRR